MTKKKKSKPTPAEQLAELTKELEKHDGLLDELVHEMKASAAASINNDGVSEQVEYIVGELGTEQAIQELRNALATAENIAKDSR